MELPADVREVLEAAGWQAGAPDDDLARDWTLALSAYVAADGRHHVVVEPARAVFASYGGLSVPAGPDGQEVCQSAFRIDPTLVLHSVTTLAELGRAVRQPLTPLGDEGDGTGILAIDGTGRVFVLDHAGDWLLGETVADALTALVRGTQPRRVGSDGTW